MEGLKKVKYFITKCEDIKNIDIKDLVLVIKSNKKK